MRRATRLLLPLLATAAVLAWWIRPPSGPQPRESAFTLRNVTVVQPGDGRRYKGRGFIQLTGRANYRSYGNILGVNLEGNPDLALDPDIASQVFAVYFTDHRIRWLAAPAPLMNSADLARAGEWEGVRVAVNGGRNGLALFLQYVNALSALNA